MQKDFALFSIELDVGQNDVLRRGVIPVVARGFLIVPDIFARVGVQSHDRAQIQIVPASGATALLAPGSTIARTDI